ncbi:hypothetical protein [Actinomyces trachealis]|uniref:hypothetical protein n=1 Tax=Actinomyces trachealis TaxID=2763540 RepID=UPI001892A6CF|nr:hypothetical protein [Actinomyces trachealis]
MLLQRHRASSLMTRLAELQPQAAQRIDDVIDPDTEAVAFVVSEQWTTMTESDGRLDSFLSYLLETYRMPLQVEEARDQAHRLRENVLMRISRAEQKAEEERARSIRGMEVALGFLTFVGMPLTVFLDVWANWEAALGIAVLRHRRDRPALGAHPRHGRRRGSARRLVAVCGGLPSGPSAVGPEYGQLKAPFSPLMRTSHCS